MDKALRVVHARISFFLQLFETCSQIPSYDCVFRLAIFCVSSARWELCGLTLSRSRCRAAGRNQKNKKCKHSNLYAMKS